MAAPAATTDVKVDEPALPVKTIEKYKAAAQVAANALKAVIEAAVEGAKVLELCQLGDSKVEEGVASVYSKKGADKVAKGALFLLSFSARVNARMLMRSIGSAHPTCVSVNSVLQNYSPLPSDVTAAAQELKKDDVVKIVVGVHIDGYASIDGETCVSSVTRAGTSAHVRQYRHWLDECDGREGRSVGGRAQCGRGGSAVSEGALALSTWGIEASSRAGRRKEQ